MLSRLGMGGVETDSVLSVLHQTHVKKAFDLGGWNHMIFYFKALLSPVSFNICNKNWRYRL